MVCGPVVVDVEPLALDELADLRGEAVQQVVAQVQHLEALHARDARRHEPQLVGDELALVHVLVGPHDLALAAALDFEYAAVACSAIGVSASRPWCSWTQRGGA